MTWPTSQIADSSAAAVWSGMTNRAQTIKTDTGIFRSRAAGGVLTVEDLRTIVTRSVAVRSYFTTNAGTTGLQSYARLVSGFPSFDLAAELTALGTRFDAVVSEARNLYIAVRDDIAVDGTLTTAPATIPANLCTAFIAACDALAAQIA